MFKEWCINEIQSNKYKNIGSFDACHIVRLVVKGRVAKQWKIILRHTLCTSVYPLVFIENHPDVISKS